MKWLQGSPAIAIYLRLLGAKIGADALISDIEVGAPDLLSVGEGASLGGRLVIANAEVVGDELIIGTVSIGADVAIGTSCVIGPDTTIGDLPRSPISPRSPPARWWERAEQWDGSPGRKVGMADPSVLPEAPGPRPAGAPASSPSTPSCSPLSRPSGCYRSSRPSTSSTSLSDSLSDITDIDYHWYLPLLTWPTAMLMTAGTVLLIAGIRWLVLPRVSSGTYSVHSGFYLRKWAV